MRLVSLTILICCLIASTTAFGLAGQEGDVAGQKFIEVKGQFVIRFADNVNLGGVTAGFGMFRTGTPSVDKIFDDYKVNSLRPLAPRDVGKSTARSRFYVVNIPDDVDDATFMRAVLANPNIVEIQNDILARIDATPNDPSFSQQYALYQASRKDLHTTETWDIEVGNENAIIAIIDSGVNYKHPDLRNNIWINPGEDLDGDLIVYDKTDFDNVDNDFNGYRDDVIGYDFYTGGGTAWPGEDASGRDNDPNDFNGHGTHCAGIAAAVNNNSTGGGGVAGGWGPSVGDGGARIMALRAGFSADEGGQEVGYVLLTAVIEAINYAVDNGADIISYSAGAANIPGMSTAVTSAMNAGIVFAASAGNEDCDCPDYFGQHSGILAVAATNRYDVRWRWYAGAGSNYGTWVEVSAPGQDIYSTVSNHYTPSYATFTGTSMATPMVAGLAALIKSHYPDFDKNEIDTMIINNADNIDVENPSLIGLLGSGRINAWNCLHNAPAAPFVASPRTGSVPLTVNFEDLNASAISRSWTFGDGGVSSDENPSHEYTTPGLYDVSLEVTDPNGTITNTKKFFIYASADTIYGDEMTMVPSTPTHDSFPVPIYMKNNIPLTGFTLSFDWITTSGDADLQFKHVSMEGTRGENFDTAIVRAIAPTTGKVAIEFVAVDLNDADRDELMPGDGPVAKLWFSASGAGEITLDTVTLIGYSLGVKSRYAEYHPEFRPIMIKTGKRGDANGDGNVDTGDPVYLINYVFKSGPAPVSTYNGDANGDGSVNVADAVYLINYIFKGGPPPPP